MIDITILLIAAFIAVAGMIILLNHVAECDRREQDHERRWKSLTGTPISNPVANGPIANDRPRQPPIVSRYAPGLADHPSYSDQPTVHQSRNGRPPVILHVDLLDRDLYADRIRQAIRWAAGDNDPNLRFELRLIHALIGDDPRPQSMIPPQSSLVDRGSEVDR